MSSVISGYNYDIFISYRQKDNKHDGWVTEFVDNLKGELESTFKEEIRVYFDINPHDGLLETHDVDESLKEKLKCLVFIPIISRTYCDPKSFAWQNEFCVFNKLAKEDQFGRDIKLLSGNVASRILPVKIHDLDPEDQTILENELGGVLRAVEFIYKEPGVNRPLSPVDDTKENLNKTKYRNQVNKVANAVKEIISAIKKFNQQDRVKPKEEKTAKFSPIKNRKVKIILTSCLILALIVLGYIFIPKFSKSAEILDKSIAVLPFENLSNDPEQEYFSDGMVEAILDRLFKVGDLEVISSTSTKRYKNTKLPLKDIARELDVSSILEGSVQKIGNNVRIIVQLINTKTDAHIWSETYDRSLSDVFSIQSEVAQSIARELRAVITPEVKIRIEKAPTNDFAAYDAFLKGQFYYEQFFSNETDEALFWFKESIRFDSTFALPWTYLSMMYWRSSPNAASPEFQEARQAAERALKLDPTSGSAIVNMAEIIDNEYDFNGAEEKIKLALKVDPDNPYVLRNAGRFYTLLGRVEESILFCNRALKDDPINPSALYYLIQAYFYAERYEEARTTLMKYHRLKYSGLPDIYYRLLLEEGNIEGIINDTLFTENNNYRIIALAASYFRVGQKNEAEKLCADLIEKNNINCNYWIAFTHTYGDEPEEVYKWLQRSFETKERMFTYLGADPAFKKFRNEPRVKELLQKMKYPI